MGKDFVKIELVAEEGASLSSGSMKLYALPYGCIDLYNYDPLNRRAAVGIMVATEYRRQGLALAMLKALEKLATSNYQIHTLFADIAAPNTASIALFQKAGYEECGHFKEWLLNTQPLSHSATQQLYIDTVRMQKII